MAWREIDSRRPGRPGAHAATGTRIAAALVAAGTVMAACGGEGGTPGPPAPAPAAIEPGQPTPTAPVEPEPTPVSPPPAPTPAEPAPLPAVALPSTPPGDQLRWVLEEAASADEGAYGERFSAAFLRAIPAGPLRDEIAAAGVGDVTEIVRSGPSELVVIAEGARGPVVLTIAVEPEPPHRITALQAVPAELPEPPASFEAVDEALTSAGARSAYLAAEVAADGAPTTIRALGQQVPVPLGSGFKLYVLGALVQAIEAGDVGWDDELTITDELKSLPSGELQDRPAGSTVTVREAAEKMIQISDNTATDLLIDRLGRRRVEAMLRPMGMGRESQRRTLPFLTTRELFVLKWGIGAEALARYVAAPLRERRAILAALDVDELAAASFDASRPVAIDEVEWFATPAEIVAAHVWLDRFRDRRGFEPLAGILGANPGIALDPATWPSVSFKGGSEPGVLALGWLLERADGRRFAIAVSVSDPDGAVDELASAAAAQGIARLLAEAP